MRRVFAMSLAGAVLFASSSASASDYYPDEIQTHLGMHCPSDSVVASRPSNCQMCHNNPNGGYGTANKRFALNMVMFGLVAQSKHSLDSALDQEKSAGTDSDGDGDTDIAALMACRDPNVPDFGGAGGDGSAANYYVPPSDPIPEYGCSAAARSGRSQEGLGASLALMAVLALVQRVRFRKERNRTAESGD